MVPEACTQSPLFSWSYPIAATDYHMLRFVSLEIGQLSRTGYHRRELEARFKGGLDSKVLEVGRPLIAAQLKERHVSSQIRFQPSWPCFGERRALLPYIHNDSSAN